MKTVSVKKFHSRGWRYYCDECPVASLYSRITICGLLSRESTNLILKQ